RGLLPADSIARAFAPANPYIELPIWDNFKGLFLAVDKGNAALKVDAYNGGLFAPNDLIDNRLVVPDLVCRGFKRLAEYEYGKPSLERDGKLIDVEILGHIFEQSITDLEELR